MLIKFQVYNRRNGKVAGEYGTRLRALRAVDKADNRYGAYAHGIRETLAPIPANQREAMGL
jgi:hypothetical protein